MTDEEIQRIFRERQDAGFKYPDSPKSTEESTKESRKKPDDTDPEAISIIATEPETETASTTRLDSRHLQAAPRRNAEELLRQVPGLTLVQHGSEGKGHQFFMRGFDAMHGADLEIKVDQIPINEWSNVHAQGYLDLALMIPELVQSISVTKGPFTLDQGAFAMAGSAHYRLGVPVEELGWRMAYTGGTTHRHRIFAGYSPPQESGEQFVGIEATHDEGFGDNRRLNRGTFNGRIRLFNRVGRSKAYLSALGSYSAFALAGPLRNDEIEAGLVDFYGAYDPQAKGRSARARLTLHGDWRHKRQRIEWAGFGEFRQLQLRENFSGFLLDPQNGDRRQQFQRSGSFGIGARHEARLSKTFTLRSGLGFRGEGFAQLEHPLGRTLEILGTRRDLKGIQFLADLRGGLRWSPLRSIRLEAGARVDLMHVIVHDRLNPGGFGQTSREPKAKRAPGTGTRVVASPRVTARWAPRERWKLFVAYGRGFRPPEARAFTRFNPGNESLGDEVILGASPIATVSDGFELGTRWDQSAFFGLSLAGFATFIQRESIFDHVSGLSLELNKTRRLGGELLLHAHPFSWLDLSADLTWVDARFVGSKRPVPFAPRIVAGIRGALVHPQGFRAGLRLLSVAPRPLPHGATGATLVMLDATLGYHWRWLRLDLEIENLLNRRVREGEYHFASHWRPQTPAQALPTLHTTAGPPLNARLTVGVQF